MLFVSDNIFSLESVILKLLFCILRYIVLFMFTEISWLESFSSKFTVLYVKLRVKDSPRIHEDHCISVIFIGVPKLEDFSGKYGFIFILYE